MPFFVRKPSKRKIQEHSDKKLKKIISSKIKNPTVNENEIDSNSEDEDFKSTLQSSSDDENSEINIQERKVILAKKYLEEIKNQEDFDENDENKETFLKRLKKNELLKSGKLKKKIANYIIYNTENKILLSCKLHKLSITCIAVSNDSRYIYSSSKDCSIVKWLLCDRKRINFLLPKTNKDKESNLNNHDCIVNCLIVSYDDKYLISGDEKGVINIWNTENLQFVHSFKAHKKSITGLSSCRETNSLYSTSEDALVKVWNLNEFGYMETLYGHQSGITSIDILNKDRVVTSGGWDKTLRVWKIPEESQLVYNGHVGNVDIVKRLDDDYFISGGDDGCLNLWVSSKKVPLYTIYEAHGKSMSNNEPNWISALAVFRNSDLIASGSCDNYIRLWKWCPQNRIIRITEIPLSGFINCIQFTLDGNYLIAGTGKEHRQGRWQVIKEAFNGIVCIPMQLKKVQ